MNKMVGKSKFTSYSLQFFFLLQLLGLTIYTNAQQNVVEFPIEEIKHRQGYLNITDKGADLLLLQFEKNSLDVVIHDNINNNTFELSTQLNFELKHYPFIHEKLETKSSRIYYFSDETRQYFAFVAYKKHGPEKVISGIVDLNLRGEGINASTLFTHKNRVKMLGISIKNRAFYLADISNPLKVDVKEISLSEDEFAPIKTYINYYPKIKKKGIKFVRENMPQELPLTSSALKLFEDPHEPILSLDGNNATHLYKINTEEGTVAIKEFDYKRSRVKFNPEGFSTILEGNLFQISITEKENPILTIYNLQNGTSKTHILNKNNWNGRASKEKLTADTLANESIDDDEFLRKLNKSTLTPTIAILKHGDRYEATFGTYDSKSIDGMPFVVKWLAGYDFVTFLTVETIEYILFDYTTSKSYQVTTNLSEEFEFYSGNTPPLINNEFRAFYQSKIKDLASFDFKDGYWYIGYFDFEADKYKIAKFNPILENKAN